MTGQPDDTARDPTDGVARIWQLYADEIGLPDANAAARTVPTAQPANIPRSTPPQRRPRWMGLRLGVASVAAVVVAVALIVGLGPQPRMLFDGGAHRAPSSDGGPVKRADGDLIAATPTALHSDGRPAGPSSVHTPVEATTRGRVDTAGSPSTSATGPIVSRDTGATPASTMPAAELQPRPILPHRIIFDFDSDVLTGDSRRALEKVAVAMKTNPDWQLLIAGHTDTHGPPAYNMALSERRAQAAKAYLESSGISGHRLRVSGFAGSRPLAANDGPQAFLNRRVEFHRR